MIDIEGTIAELKRLYGDGRKMPTRRCWICHFYFGYYFVDDPSEIRYDQGCYCRGQTLATEPTAMSALREFIDLWPLRAKAWIRYRERELTLRAKQEKEREDYYRELARQRRLAKSELPFEEPKKKPKAQTKAEIQAALYAAAIRRGQLD